jgi:hypothetical protein
MLKFLLVRAFESVSRLLDLNLELKLKAYL